MALNSFWQQVRDRLASTASADTVEAGVHGILLQLRVLGCLIALSASQMNHHCDCRRAAFSPVRLLLSSESGSSPRFKAVGAWHLTGQLRAEQVKADKGIWCIRTCAWSCPSHTWNEFHCVNVCQLFTYALLRYCPVPHCLVFLVGNHYDRRILIGGIVTASFCLVRTKV